MEAILELAELLRQVQGGKRFTITNRGRAICEPANARGAAAALAKFIAFREANPVRKHVDIRALVEEGRE